MQTCNVTSEDLYIGKNQLTICNVLKQNNVACSSRDKIHVHVIFIFVHRIDGFVLPIGSEQVHDAYHSYRQLMKFRKPSNYKNLQIK